MAGENGGKRKGGRKWRERGRAGENGGNEEGRKKMTGMRKGGRIKPGESVLANIRRYDVFSRDMRRAGKCIFERDAEGGKMHAAVGVRAAERT